MEEIIIGSATRTPIGEFGGSLREVPASELAIGVMRAAVDRIGLEKKYIDHMFMGNCFEPLDNNVARIASVKAGFPVEIPAITISATCGSSMQAIINGVQCIRDGAAEAVMSGGVESMSNAPYIVTTCRWGQRLMHSQMYDLLWKAMQDGGNRGEPCREVRYHTGRAG
jgi:acetyl-CoA C-acetyltransferase